MPRRRVTTELTVEQRAAYLRNPLRCPFCGSSNIHAGEMTPSLHDIYQSVLCERCNRQWTEMYVLTDIALEEDCDVRNRPPWFEPI
jgi:transposase-like protein